VNRVHGIVSGEPETRATRDMFEILDRGLKLNRWDVEYGQITSEI
jgi:hypothetical protein